MVRHYKDAGERGDKPNKPRRFSTVDFFFFFSIRMNLLIYATFWRGEQMTKRVRPTGEVPDDILTVRFST